MERLEDDFECRFAGLPKNGRLLVWEITNKCNLNCYHCCNNSNPFVDTKDEVPVEIIKEVVKQFKANRIVQAYFSGGEPFCRNDIFEILSLIDTDYTEVSVASNGTLLANEGYVEKLRKTNIRAISISLDSHIPNIHDRIRNQEGAFEKTIIGIKKCVEAGIVVRLSSMVLPSNFDSMEEQLRFFISLGVENITLRTIFPVGRAEFNKQLIVDIDFTNIINLVDSLNKEFPEVNIEHNFSKDSSKNCSSACVCHGADNLIHIDSKGFVSSCSWLYKFDRQRFNGGNIKSYSLELCIKNMMDIMTQLRQQYPGCPLEELVQ